jgi:hypothetical protein
MAKDQPTDSTRNSMISINSDGDLEIDLPKDGKQLKETIKDHWNRTRPVALLVTTVLSFIIAIGSWSRPKTDTSTVKNSYGVLSDQIKELSKQIQQEHDDLNKLRGYVDGLNQQQTKIQKTQEAMLVTDGLLSKQDDKSDNTRVQAHVTLSNPGIAAAPMALPPPQMSPKPADVVPPDFEKTLSGLGK